MSNRKDRIIHLTIWSISRLEVLEEVLMVKLIFQIMQKKSDLKNATHVDTSSFALKSNLASLKTEIDKLGIDKLVPVPVDVIKLSDVVKNDVIKKAVYDKLVAKVNNIDTSAFALKIKSQTNRQIKIRKENSGCNWPC